MTYSHLDHFDDGEVRRMTLLEGHHRLVGKNNILRIDHLCSDEKAEDCLRCRLDDGYIPDQRIHHDKDRTAQSQAV